MNRRRFMAKKSRLPSRYQEVEWIGNTTNSYLLINKQFAFYIDDYIYVKAEYRGDNISIGQPATIFSNDNQITRTYLTCSVTTFNVGTETNKCHWSDYIVKNVPFEAVLKDRKATINGNLRYVYSAQQKSDTNSIILFRNSLESSFSRPFVGCVYRIIIGNIFDLIPCYRKSDGEIGIYDLVSKTFFTNQGTGTFEKGPNVN